MMDEAGLLDGVRVIDLSRVLAGPYAAQVLAEMGADVVKVESPGGDPSRGIGPHVDGESLYFAAVNTGKRGIVLDLTTDAGHAALDALLAAAHIVIHNFRPDVAARFGCDARSIRSRHPHVTVVTVSGYAQDSTRGGEPAFDLTVQAESGIMSLTGESGGAPVRAGVPVGDLAAGHWAALAAVAGYAGFLRDGRGRHVEVPLLDATLPLLSYVATAAAAAGVDPPNVGSGHHAVVPYGAFPTADGWIVIAIIGDTLWPRLCRALGIDDLAHREDLATNRARAAARDTVDAEIVNRTSRLTTDDVLSKLYAAGVPAAPVNGVLAALDSPYVRERGVVADVSTGAGMVYRVVQGPLRGDCALRPAPRLGEHTQEILSTLPIRGLEGQP